MRPNAKFPECAWMCGVCVCVHVVILNVSVRAYAHVCVRVCLCAREAEALRASERASVRAYHLAVDEYVCVWVGLHRVVDKVENVLKLVLDLAAKNAKREGGREQREEKEINTGVEHTRNGNPGSTDVK